MFLFTVSTTVWQNNELIKDRGAKIRGQWKEENLEIMQGNGNWKIGPFSKICSWIEFLDLKVLEQKMEPMALGSPLSNPASPPHFGSLYHNQPSVIGTPVQGPAHTHNGFLPGYLMGDYAQQVSSQRPASCLILGLT